jgi:methionine-rich copper-binding protein CopC
VESETPPSGATDVAVSAAPSVTFDEAVQSSTISFTLRNSAGTAVAASVSYNSTTHTATFAPSSALAYDTKYTATLSGAADSSGKPMSAPLSWTFTTDTASPAIKSETPASGGTGVAVSTAASATFNEAVQSSTITFTLTNSSNYTVTLTPSAALAYSTTYTATVIGLPKQFRRRVGLTLCQMRVRLDMFRHPWTPYKAASAN